MHGEQDVLLVHAGEGHERAAGGQTLLVEQLAVGAVTVDNGCRRQLFRQKFTAFQTVFDDLDRNAGIEQDLREEKGDLAAADEPMAVLIGILGTPTWSKKSFCSFGGMMTVTSSPVCRIKSPFGM